MSDPRFPTPSGVGLIEAPNTESVAFIAAYFPRLRAWASLKPDVEPLMQPGAGNFPRLRAWASLKQIYQRHADDLMNKFPTPSGVGLIEAT